MFTSLATALLLAAKLEFVVPDANFSLREGLPAVQVLSLYQDRYGALWAGTTAGLAELGGPVIQAFGPEQGLSRAAVFAIAEEPSGAIVAGTASGISRLVRGRFEPVPLPPAAAQLPVKRFVRSRDGTLWALAGDRMVLRYFSGQWNVVGIDGALAFEATDLAIDEMGALWLATRNHGLLRLAPLGTRFQKSAQFQPAPDVFAGIDHVATSRGRAYFTSSRGLSVLSVAAGGVVETTPFPPGAGAGHRALEVTPSGQVFVGTSAGVLTLEGRSLVPLASRNDRARAPAVVLLNDREGQLWVGTMEGGLNLLLMGRGVRFLRADKESFRSIDVDKGGVHWVSNERRILYFRTDDAGNPIAYGEARVEGFDALTIYGIEEDPGGGLLFAMDGGVGFLSRASRASGAMLIQHDPRFEILRDRFVTAVHRDRGGALWAVSPLGIYRLERGRQEAQSVPFPSGNPWMAAMDTEGFLWVATRQGTLDAIDTATQRVTAAALPRGRHVEFLGPSPDRGVVVTFENGSSAFFTARVPDGSIAMSAGPERITWLSVLSLLKMGDRYLAAHGGDRLSQIRLATGVVEQTILTSADLEDSDFRYLSLREGRAGQFWFTLLNGIGRLDPPTAPPEPSRLRLDQEEAIVLAPRPNAIDLHAQLSDPVASRKARYRYRLLGETDQWSEWSSDPHIPISNVAPGEYRLEVEAEDRYGRQPSPVSIEVEAAAHWWESWPFRTVALLAGLGGAYGLYLWRVRGIELERLALAAAVKAGRADLEAANQRLQELSLTDMLTGLRNRRYFSEVVEDELRLLKRRFDERGSSGDPNRDALFFLLDLDRFKTVNDLFGHAGGDAVLQETARRLSSLLRRTDRLIRWGGEEFLVVSLDCQKSEAPEMASRILSAISEHPYPVGPEGGLRITTSIGWAAYPFSLSGAEPHPEDVVRLADRGLYRAKRAGRNCAVGISPALDGPITAGPVEVLKDIGIPVVFTTVKGVQRDGGVPLESLRGSGPVPRLS
ncbi:MAG: diguanylate cyclase [Vicinamibacteria bacterium]|nr:diguanylate cyclase [Vicinamibacteria bacterium]